MLSIETCTTALADPVKAQLEPECPILLATDVPLGWPRPQSSLFAYNWARIMGQTRHPAAYEDRSRSTRSHDVFDSPSNLAVLAMESSDGRPSSSWGGNFFEAHRAAISFRSPTMQRINIEMNPKWHWLDHNPAAGRSFGDSRELATPQRASSLVRETAQNSLDAGSDGKQVAIRYRLIDLPRGTERRRRFENAADLVNLRSHLQAICDSNKPAEVAERLKSKLAALDNDETLRLLAIEDYGTSGLKGHEFESGSNFAALTRNSRDSEKSDDAARGSFGLGSGTLWACSGFLSVVFASRLRGEEGRGIRLFGKSALGYHPVGKAAYTGPGYFGAPYEHGGAVSQYVTDDNQALLEALCVNREQIEGIGASGTTALILSFEDPESDEEGAESILHTIEKSVAEHLWPAIAEGSLRVFTRYEQGDHYEHAPDDEINVDKWMPSFVEAYRKEASGEVTDELREPGDVLSIPISHTIPATKATVREPDQHDELGAEARLVVRLASEGAEDDKYRDHVACTRGAAMVTQYWKRNAIGLNTRPFHAILKAGTLAGRGEVQEAAEKFLRNSEEPSHESWRFWQRVKSYYVRGAGKFLSELFDRCTEKLVQAIEKEFDSSEEPPEGLSRLVRIPSASPGTPSSFRIKNAKREEHGGLFRFALDVEVDKPEGKLFQLKVMLATDSGSSVPAEITSLNLNGVEVDEIRGLKLDSSLRKFTLSGTAAPQLPQATLSRCALRVAGKIRSAQ